MCSLNTPLMINPVFQIHISHTDNIQYNVNRNFQVSVCKLEHPVTCSFILILSCLWYVRFLYKMWSIVSWNIWLYWQSCMTEAHKEHKTNNKRGNAHNFSILPQNCNSVVCLYKDIFTQCIYFISFKQQKPTQISFKPMYLRLICSIPCIRKDISVHITIPTNAHM